MKRLLTLLMAMTLFSWNSANIIFATSMDMNHGNMQSGEMEKMDHNSVGGVFTHNEIVDGVKAEFQIMNLESMNMKDPDGNTHHIMVKFFNKESSEQIKDVVGKIKIIGPSGKEQEGVLTDYSGIYAANFTFDQQYKYGVICLFKAGDKKRVVKFWYLHN